MKLFIKQNIFPKGSSSNGWVLAFPLPFCNVIGIAKLSHHTPLPEVRISIMRSQTEKQIRALTAYIDLFKLKSILYIRLMCGDSLCITYSRTAYSTYWRFDRNYRKYVRFWITINWRPIWPNIAKHSRWDLLCYKWLSSYHGVHFVRLLVYS